MIWLFIIGRPTLIKFKNVVPDFKGRVTNSLISDVTLKSIIGSPRSKRLVYFAIISSTCELLPSDRREIACFAWKMSLIMVPNVSI